MDFTTLDVPFSDDNSNHGRYNFHASPLEEEEFYTETPVDSIIVVEQGGCENINAPHTSKSRDNRTLGGPGTDLVSSSEGIHSSHALLTGFHMDEQLFESFMNANQISQFDRPKDFQDTYSLGLQHLSSHPFNASVMSSLMSPVSPVTSPTAAG
jgi:hypothetical protein